MMKHTENLLFRKQSLIKPVACLTLALSAIMSGHSAFATTATAADGGVVWCNGDGSAYASISGFPAATAPDGLSANPADTFDGWMSNPILINGVFGATAETVAPAGTANANDRYAIQLNYWNSAANSVAANATNAPFGYAAGNSCVLFYYNTGNIGQFTITYPSAPPLPRQAEINWHLLNPTAFPTFVPFADFNKDANGKDISFKANSSTKGGPTGYISTFKGCSWDNNSCTAGSAIPTGTAVPPKSTDSNVFPEKLSDIASIPSQWSISYNGTYGNPGGTETTTFGGQTLRAHIWDASYDIWFDSDAHTATGHAPYGLVRGQNDGLEIMVWMNSNGSYVDAGTAGTIPGEDQPGLIQPTGHIRERVVINGALYDVWVGRLDNPYFGHPNDSYLGQEETGATAPPAGQSDPKDEPSNCKTLTVNGGNGTLCGAQWNVVSFVATKDNNGTDYRGKNMSLDAKIFTDYILGIPDGDLWKVYGNPVVGNPRGTNSVLQCPADNKDQSLAGATANCLSPSWYLTSIQAGFEPWVGGNGLQSDSFKAHVIVNAAGVQTGLVNDAGQTIIHWGTPFEAVYAGCSSGTVKFNIEGTNADTNTKMWWPGADGTSFQQMNGPDPVTGQYTFMVPALAPMHGDTKIHFVSSVCGNTDVSVYIDPSGQVFFSDGKTPVQGANVTLLRSSSNTASGPFVAVPNHNQGLSTPVMQPNDNTQNAMKSTAIGSYAWNTIAGWYEVNAQLSGCGSVTTLPQQVTATHAIENLNITLPCAPPLPLPPPPSGTPGVNVQLTLNGADWAHGYCRNVVLTNTTSKPITWKVQFALPFSNSVVDPSNHWNLNYSQSGNTVTAWGVGWNSVIQPGQTLKDQGFCASK